MHQVLNSDVQGTVRGAPSVVGETIVGDIVPAPQVSSQEYLMQDLPPGTVTFLPPPLPHESTVSGPRSRQQQVTTWLLFARSRDDIFVNYRGLRQVEKSRWSCCTF